MDAQQQQKNETHQPKPGGCPFCGAPFPCLAHGTPPHQH